MGVIGPKYHQGTLKTEWKIQQCQGEKAYFKFEKDCQRCEARSHCYTIKVKPFGVEMRDKVLVFAETMEDAKQFATKGHGFRVFSNYRKAESAFPYKVERQGNTISFEIGDKE